MDELLRQLDGLILSSVPTLILFVALVLAYRFILFGKLMKVREERRARTAGAVEKAHLAIAAADTRVQEYEARLRAARADIFRHREQRLQMRYAERDAALDSARLAAQQRVREAKAALDVQRAEVQKQIEAAAGQMAAQVLAVILPPAAVEGSH
jgi:F-type H+-transporting ATPase subunit b